MVTTAIAKPQAADLSFGFDRESINLIKSTVAKGTTDLELNLFLYQASKTGLDPLARQIFCVKRWSNKTDKEEMTIQTSIDGYRLIADRTGKYAGNDDYEFDSDDNPKWAKSTVYKMVEGQRCPFTATARWDQYFPGEKQGFMWKKMPHVMLGKCAEALALRKAFPADLSGVYTNEEMQQASRAESIEVQAEVARAHGIDTPETWEEGRAAQSLVAQDKIRELKSSAQAQQPSAGQKQEKGPEAAPRPPAATEPAPSHRADTGAETRRAEKLPSAEMPTAPNPKLQPPELRVTATERSRLWAEAGDAGLDLHAFILAKYGFETIKQIDRRNLEAIIIDIKSAAVPKKKAVPEPTSGPHEPNLEPLLRISNIIVRIKRAQPATDTDWVLQQYFKTKSGKSIPMDELKAFVTATKLAWVNSVCDKMEADFKELLEHSETDQDLPLELRP